MNLSLKQVAEIFRVSETTVIQWINTENLPTELVSDQFRFGRSEVLEWASLHKKSFSPTIYGKVNGDPVPAATHLADALEVGGVIRDVVGSTLRDVLVTVLSGLPVPESFGIDALLELFLAREHLGSTAIGNGIAIPHPRRPVLLTVPVPLVRLCFLRDPLNMAAPDGKPVNTLFLIVCPTAHDHLQLLALISAVLRVEAVLDALRDKVDTETLLELMREVGRRFHDDRPDKSTPRPSTL